MIFGRQALWRDTMRPARFLVFDARLIVAVALMLFHIRIWTIAVLLTTAGLLFFFEKWLGLDVPNIVRWVRAKFSGRLRPARRRMDRRSMVDFAFELRSPFWRKQLGWRAQRLAKAEADAKDGKGKRKRKRRPGWWNRLGTDASKAAVQGQQEVSQ